MTKILMVCLGNICRSPLAEGIMRSKLPSETFLVDSAGTAGYHIGKSPDPRSIAVAKRHGLDISSQNCRQFKVEDLDEFDHIFVMDESNFNNVMALGRQEEDISKVRLILDLLHPGQGLEVPDPYYGGDHGFDEVYAMLDQACNAFIEKLS